MKLPEYSLKDKVIVVKNRFSQDTIEYPPGTLVFPFWNETLLPSHRAQELKEAKRMKSEPLVMCIIGRDWVPVEKSKIRRNY